LSAEDQQKLQAAVEGLNSKVEEAPKAEDAPKNEEAPEAEEAKAQEAPKAEEAAKAEEAPKADEAPKIEEAAKAEEEQKPAEAPKSQEAPEVEDAPKVEEAAKTEEAPAEAAKEVPAEPEEDETDKKLKPAFADIDKDSSGFIEAKELKAVLKQMQIEMDDDKVEGVLKLADTNGDQKLDYAEYKKLVCKALQK